MKCIAARDTSGDALPGEKVQMAASQSERVLLALRPSALFLDALIVFASMAFAFWIEWRTPRFWLGEAHSIVPLWKLLSAFGGFAVVLLWMGGQHHDSTLRPRNLLQEQRLNLQDCAISGFLLFSVLYLLRLEALSRGFVLFIIVLVAFGLGLRRLIYRTFRAKPGGSRNVLIVGADSTALAIRDQLREDPKLGYIFKGFVRLSNAESDKIDDPDDVIGSVDKLAEHVCKYSVNEVFLTPSCSREMALKLVSQARELGIHSRMVLGHLRLDVNQTNRSQS